MFPENDFPHNFLQNKIQKLVVFAKMNLRQAFELVEIRQCYTENAVILHFTTYLGMNISF